MSKTLLGRHGGGRIMLWGRDRPTVRLPRQYSQNVQEELISVQIKVTPRFFSVKLRRILLSELNLASLSDPKTLLDVTPGGLGPAPGLHLLLPEPRPAGDKSDVFPILDSGFKVLPELGICFGL